MDSGAEETIADTIAVPKRHVHYTPHVKLQGVGGKIFDWLAISLSALCLIHCLATPVLLVVLPTTFAFFGKGDRIHSMLLMILPVLALLAFVPGYFRHRNLQIFMWSLPGFALLTFALFFLQSYIWAESAVSICGSLFLIRAHLLNRRLSECC